MVIGADASPMCGEPFSINSDNVKLSEFFCSFVPKYTAANIADITPITTGIAKSAFDIISGQNPTAQIVLLSMCCQCP